MNTNLIGLTIIQIAENLLYCMLIIMPNQADKSASKTESTKSHSNRKITKFVTKSSKSPVSVSATKRTSSILSPPENSRDSKKINIEMDTDKEKDQDLSISSDCQMGEVMSDISESTNIQHVLGPLMNELKLLRETVDKNYAKLEEVQRGMSIHQNCKILRLSSVTV